MITKYKYIEELFKKISEEIQGSTTIYVIGGAVLLYQDLKPVTKDTDIIVETRKEFLAIQQALIKIGFKPQIPGKEYERMNLNQIYKKDDAQIDLFEKEVCGKFSLSRDMKQRAKEIHNFEDLKVMHCSNEDIFLFKTMTERDGDLEDCKSLSRTELDWNEILKELKSQIQKSKQDVWITWVGERLDILEEEGLIIPIMSQIDKLRLKFFKDLEKSQLQ